MTTVAAVAVLGLGASVTAAVPAAAAPVEAAVGAAAAAEVDYATWQKDVKAVVDTATPYIQQRTANSSGQKLAVVFDIDNTTLETHYTPWYQLPTPALKPSLELAKYAKSRGSPSSSSPPGRASSRASPSGT